MAYFSSIHKKVKDFFDKKNYDLHRTFKVAVRGDKTEWSLENKLTDDGKLESELKATNEFERDTLTFTASNKDPDKDKDKENPKFEWKTKRFDNYFDVTTTVKQNIVEFDHKKQQGKFNLQAITKYNWIDDTCHLILSPTYVGIDNLIVGLKYNLERTTDNNYHHKYDLGFQYDVNKTQLWSLVTDNSMKKVKVGGAFKFDYTTAYGEFIYDLSKPEKQNSQLASTYSIGVQSKLSDVSTVSAVFRHDYTAAFLYNLDFPQNKVNAHLGLNFNPTIANKYSLGWKLIFSP